ncbi:MAG: DUF1207 domain-containing protein [Ignavibacteria bacterium]|nr:DUF1207 domain-containing protein [Ignavibacteria bacterium]
MSLLLLILLYFSFAKAEDNDLVRHYSCDHSKARISCYDSHVKFFPRELIYPPNFSNPFEAKVGSIFSLSGKGLQLDIGAAKDLIHIKSDKKNTFGLGAEFFTWSMLRSQSNFKFPVDAIDYFFGGYFSHRTSIKNIKISSRLRISHISAHLVDGSYNSINKTWNNSLEPFVYSREFTELSSAIEWKQQKLYLTINYLFHAIPEVKSNLSFGTGAEFLLYTIKNPRAQLFGGLDIKFHKTYDDNYKSDKSISAGIHFGKWNSSGLRIIYNYYSGKHLHGEFSRFKLNRSSIGAYLLF